MKQRDSGTVRHAIIGITAGVAGTAVMMAMRLFDQKYAPRTIAKTKADPGEFMVHAAEHATGAGASIPKAVEQVAAMATHIGYGTSFGVIYGLVRGHCKHRSALADGIVLGSTVYAVGHLGWLPFVGLTSPVWEQKLPEIGGELLRHVAYGIATAATYGMIDAAL